MEIISACEQHAAQVASIYNYYILNSIATFELKEVDEIEMANRIKTISSKYPYLVALLNEKIVGYAYANEWKQRSAYKNSAEVTIYLSPDATGKGIGRALYSELSAELRKTELHTVVGGIAQPNDSSIALHEKLGFNKIAHFKEIGFKFNKWIDVAYWQLLL